MRTSLLPIGVVVFLTVVDSVPAQNLVRNHDFDTDISEWTVNPSATWSGAKNHGDVSGKPSGALLIGNGRPTATQCVKTGLLKFMDFAIWFSGNSSSCHDSHFEYELTFFSDANCTSSPVDYDGSGSSPVGDEEGWAGFETYRELRAPANSARINVSAYCDSGVGSANIYVDDMLLENEQIFFSDFEIFDQHL